MEMSERSERLLNARAGIHTATIEASSAVPGAAPDVARAIAVARTHLDTARLWLAEAERIETLAEMAKRDLAHDSGGGAP